MSTEVSKVWSGSGAKIASAIAIGLEPNLMRNLYMIEKVKSPYNGAALKGRILHLDLPDTFALDDAIRRIAISAALRGDVSLEAIAELESALERAVAQARPWRLETWFDCSKSIGMAMWNLEQRHTDGMVLYVREALEGYRILCNSETDLKTVPSRLLRQDAEWDAEAVDDVLSFMLDELHGFVDLLSKADAELEAAKPAANIRRMPRDVFDFITAATRPLSLQQVFAGMWLGMSLANKKARDHSGDDPINQLHETLLHQNMVRDVMDVLVPERPMLQWLEFQGALDLAFEFSGRMHSEYVIMERLSNIESTIERILGRHAPFAARFFRLGLKSESEQYRAKRAVSDRFACYERSLEAAAGFSFETELVATTKAETPVTTIRTEESTATRRLSRVFQLENCISATEVLHAMPLVSA